MHFKNRQRGFSLIEIMVVVATLGILASIAYPSYMNSVQKSRRADAKDALMRAAALQERWYLQRNQYTNSAANVGGAVSTEGYYAISAAYILNGTDCSATSTCFTLTATAQNAQTADSDCRRLTVDNLGRKRSFDDGDAETDGCW